MGNKNRKLDSLSRRPIYIKSNTEEKPENILDIKNVKKFHVLLALIVTF